MKYRSASLNIPGGVWFRKARDQLRRLKAQGMLPPATEEWLPTVEKDLNDLPR